MTNVMTTLMTSHYVRMGLLVAAMVLMLTGCASSYD